jgi:hypothetical protein
MTQPEEFELDDWYRSEPAKRSFSRICTAVNREGATIRLLGIRTAPLLVLADAKKYPRRPEDYEITIEEAKADWPAFIDAALLGTRFRIMGRTLERAVLFRGQKVRHPSEKYLRSSSKDANGIAQKLEELAKDIRKLTYAVTRSSNRDLEGDFVPVAESMKRSADLIDRRFREMWRASNGLPAETMM